jgi:membrane protein DedA with SNARE-associated domain
MLALIGDPTSLVSSFGYVAIFALCVAQSCCVPTSSELTMGFAGALAATGRLSLPGAIGVGALGELVGAYLAWVIGRTAGRAVVDRYGKYLLLTHRDLDRAEAWYERHGSFGVLGGRLVPVLRNFAALPAGVAEVPAIRFGLLTFVGSLIWDGAMAGIGYGVGSRWHAIVHAFADAGYLLAGLAAIALVAAFVHRWRSYRAQVGPEVASPTEELKALVGRLAAPGAGLGERNGAAANERLTAAAAAVVFVLLFFEGVTLVRIGSMMALHVILGLVLVPPLLVKLASTGWRFVRYYMGHPDFVRKGPPKALLRVLAPFLVATTVVLLASGIALVVVSHPYGWLAVVHRFDFLAWFALASVHVLYYVWQVPGLLRRDLSHRRRYRRSSPKGRRLRPGVALGALAAGVALAGLLWPSIASQVHTFFRTPHSQRRPAATLARSQTSRAAMGLDESK